MVSSNGDLTGVLLDILTDEEEDFVGEACGVENSRLETFGSLEASEVDWVDELYPLI